MRHRPLLILLLTLAVAFDACRREAAHLSQAQMAPVVADLQLADSYSALVRDSSRKFGEKNYDSLARWTTDILAQHGLSRAEFSHSMDWYRDHPVALDSLFAAVIPILEKKR